MTDPKCTTALVVGAGIGGITAALDIANSGFQVVLVEREPSIGGHMAQLSETFPTLDCSQCIMTPRTVEVGHHDRIRLHTYSEIESIERTPSGTFDVRIRRRATHVDWAKCTGCGVCQEKCPFKVESLFERGIGPRKVIYTLSPQAVPNKPVIDAAHCRYLQSLGDMQAGRLPAVDKHGNPASPKCGACAKLCPTGAIEWEQQDAVFEEEVGAVILATGYDLLPMSRLPEYGGGELRDVVDGLAFERMLAASGPTAGKVLRPSDGAVPKHVVFVQCSGSRDPERGMPYCSKICCLYVAKQAMLYKHRVPDGEASVFYIDVRAGGKGYEEFVTRAQEEHHVRYLRGKVSRIYAEDGRLIVKGADTLGHRAVEIAADLVVLATAIVPRAGNPAVAALCGVAADEHGFFVSGDEEMAPVDSRAEAVFLAGAALGPKDIPETVAQASGAAAKVLSLFQRRRAAGEAVARPAAGTGAGRT